MVNNYPIKNLYGLVLAGGKSTRMGKDKASLEYHGKKQFVYCYDLLLPFCEKVFISKRKEQEIAESQAAYPQIHDEDNFRDIGPLGGILSAISKYPKMDWLVLGCDLPFVNKGTLEFLIQNRDAQKSATAFVSVQDNLPEPLCTIYEAHASGNILAHFKNGKTCPRKYLINSNVELLHQPDKSALDNVNNPQEYQETLKRIHDDGR